MSAMTETNVMPNQKYLSELTIRLDTITRFMGSQGNGNGYRSEAEALADQMVQRAGELRNALRDRRGKAQSLDQLRESLSGMALVSEIRNYDRALEAVQNAVGDKVNEYERATEQPDRSGRDCLDALEASHLRLHHIMREICEAAAV